MHVLCLQGDVCRTKSRRLCVRGSGLNMVRLRVCCLGVFAPPAPQATHVFPNERPSRSEMLLELRHAKELALEGVQTRLHPEVEARVLLCTANLRRWQNGVTATVFNACLLWTFRHQCAMHIVGFGEDNDAMTFLSWACAPALDHGLLMLGSGGSAACRAGTITATIRARAQQ